MKITEIRVQANRKGTNIKKASFKLNKQDAYKVYYSDGDVETLTKKELIERARMGLI